VLGITESQLQH